MAKGENLEKPKKKGGMVIVIGMGAKPKDSVKKAYGRGSEDAKLAQRNKMFNRLKSGRNDIEDILDKRRIDSDEFHGEFRHRFNMDFDEYLNSENAPNINLQELIDDMAERSHSQRRQQGREESRQSRKAEAIRNGLLDTQRFRGALTSNGIDEGTWLRHVRSIPDDELTDNTFNDLMSQLRGRDGEMEGADYDSSEAAFRDRDERRGYAIMPKNIDANDEDADEMLNRLTRIFETRGYRNPMQAALEHMVGTPQGKELGLSGLDDEEHGYSDTYSEGSRDGAFGSVRNAPSTVFTVPFAGGGQMADRARVGRNNPKGSVESEIYGFRGAGPIRSSNRRPIEDQEADMDAVEANMYRASSDSTNVMDAAWALLKNVDPRVMEHAQRAEAENPQFNPSYIRRLPRPHARSAQRMSEIREQAMRNEVPMDKLMEMNRASLLGQMGEPKE